MNRFAQFSRMQVAALPVLFLLTAFNSSTAQAPVADAVTWHFDQIAEIGGHATEVLGHPHVIESPYGKAVEFSGNGDALIVPEHPLAGAKAFTWEVIFRPDGNGAQAQRFFHMAERDPSTGKDTQNRLLFEIRIVDGQWCLDSYAGNRGQQVTLLNCKALHPLDKWYRATAVWDGKVLKNYVDDELQGEGPLVMEPEGPGRSSIGMRLNGVYPFKGAVLMARMVPRALPPDEFLKMPAKIDEHKPAQPFAELDANRVQQIAGMLTAQPAGFGVPCSDRAAWAAKASALESSVAEAEQILTKPLPAFDPDGYLAFTRTGDRQPMERNLHAREDQLVPLVLAECVEYKGRFLPRIAEVMDSLVAQPSWTLSAHDAQLLNFHGERYYVDLNAADMGDTLAESLYLLGDRVPAETRARVTAGMEKHVFGPMRESFRHGNPTDDRGANWWLYADMNWNAVCVKGVTGAALAMLPDVNDRALFVAAAEHYIQHYDKGFGGDGYDTEGLGYWNYGFSHFIELRENVFRATSGKIDLLGDEKMQRVAMFGLQFPMLPNNAAAYGDAGRMPRADAHLVAMIDHIFGLPQAAPLAVESTGMQHVGLTSICLDLFPVPGDQIVSASAQALSHATLQTYFGESGVLVSRAAPGQNFAVTIKAGGNTTHSHNDIGSFVLGMGATQPIGDPGGPAFYTGATFGPHRLDSKLLNSFGHPVPEIGGNLQLDATKVKVSVTAHAFSDAEDSITIDMTNAYKVAELKSVTRTLVHSRMGAGSVAITDDFALSSPTEIIESLPTHGTWEQVDAHTLLFKQDGEQVRVVVDAPVPVTFSETKVNEYVNPFTRVEVHVPLAGSGKVTLRFTPAQ